MFCPKCGKEIPEGSTFCSSCGTNVNTMSGPGDAAKPSAAGAAFSGLGGFLKGYFASPVQTTRNTLAKGDLITPLILMGAQLIACILMFLGFSLKIGMMSYGYVEVPFQFWFLGGLLGDAIAVIIFVALLFGGAKILKSSCTFQDAVIACGCHSICITALMVVDFLCFLISLQLGVWVMIITLILWVALGVSSFQMIAPELESGKSWLIYLGVAAITIILTLLILGNGLFPALSGSRSGLTSSLFGSVF